MTREQKQEFVLALQEQLAGAEAVYLTDFTGLDVKAMTVLRRELKKSSGEYVVVKNRLLRRALGDRALPHVDPHLNGPTGLVIGIDSAVDAARVVVDFAKDHGDRPTFKVGVIESGALTPEEIVRISQLPPREDLLAQVAGALSAPMSAPAVALQGKLHEMAGLADALREERTVAADAAQRRPAEDAAG